MSLSPQPIFAELHMKVWIHIRAIENFHIFSLNWSYLSHSSPKMFPVYACLACVYLYTFILRRQWIHHTHMSKRRYVSWRMWLVFVAWQKCVVICSITYTMICSLAVPLLRCLTHVTGRLVKHCSTSCVELVSQLKLSEPVYSYCLVISNILVMLFHCSIIIM